METAVSVQKQQVAVMVCAVAWAAEAAVKAEETETAEATVTA